jgi:lipoyl(octanoyl) transferase
MTLSDLGVAGYDETLALQHQLVAARQAQAIPDTLLLVEHPPVITLGRRREALGHVLAAGTTPVVQVERGGDVTWHGPGQLVGYPILFLGEHERDVHAVLRRLEEAFIGLLGELGLDALRRPGHTGVWARRPESDEAPVKLVSLGLAIRGWVTFHGFALNVDCDLSEFARIQPCGLESSVMGSLASLGARLPPPGALRQRVAARVAAALGRVLERAPIDDSAAVP